MFKVRRLTPFAAIAALALGACTSAAAPSGVGSLGADMASASMGRAYAEENCASCHAVTAGQTRSPNPAAPTFETAANTPGMTSMAFNVWLQTPHPSMPNLIVGPDHIDDLSAYLATLRKPN
jgi:mono/diheme cytochrome c family protein